MYEKKSSRVRLMAVLQYVEAKAKSVQKIEKMEVYVEDVPLLQKKHVLGKNI